MKKNIIFLSLFAILFIGCSKDDSPSEEAVSPINEKLLSAIDNLPAFEYNSDKTVKKLTFTNQLQMVYQYNDSKVTTMEIISGGQNEIYTYGYDGDGRINSVTKDGVVTVIHYSAGDNYYSYVDDFDAIIGVYLNEDSSIDMYQTIDGGDIQTYKINYDEVKKGPMFNSNNILLPTILGRSQFVQLLFLQVSQKPILGIGTPLGFLNYDNTFDEQDFLIKSVLTLDENPYQTYSYTYNQE